MLLVEYIAKHTGKKVRANQIASAPAGPYVFLRRLRDTIDKVGIADYAHYDHKVTFRITAYRENAFESMLNLRAAIMRDSVEVDTFRAQEPGLSDILDISDYAPMSGYHEKASMELTLKYRNRLFDVAPSIERVQIHISTETTETDIEVQA